MFFCRISFGLTLRAARCRVASVMKESVAGVRNRGELGHDGMVAYIYIQSGISTAGLEQERDAL